MTLLDDVDTPRPILAGSTARCSACGSADLTATKRRDLDPVVVDLICLDCRSPLTLSGATE